MLTPTNEPRPISIFAHDLYDNQIFPSITQAFTVNGHPPKDISDIAWVNKDEVDVVLSGQVFTKSHITVHTLGVIIISIIYNIDHDALTPNQFTRVLIREINAESEEKVYAILTLLVKLANLLDIKIINVDNVKNIQPHTWTDMDLFMILYTGQSIYSRVGFIQVTYPQLLQDIRILLYTPLSELMIPSELMENIQTHFGITVGDTLNTIFFILYPIYIKKTYTAKDGMHIKKLYRFLKATNRSVYIYTRTTMCVPYNYPVPGTIGPAVPPQYQQPYKHGELLGLLKLPDDELEIYNDNLSSSNKPTKSYNQTARKPRKKNATAGMPNTDRATRRL